MKKHCEWRVPPDLEECGEPAVDECYEYGRLEKVPLCAEHFDAAWKRWGDKLFTRQGMA